MATLSASTLFKKQDGVFAVTKDKTSVSWTPTQTGASPALTLEVAKITNLQQTPPDKPKAILKVVYAESGQTEPASYAFQFTSKTDARGEMNVIRDVLSEAMAKAKQTNVAPAATGGASAAMTIAAAISGGKGSTWEDDEKLISDVRLQQGLLKDNPELQKTFMEARNLKPESLSLTQFTKQFWASRVHLLRAHALSQTQTKGLYNVFSIVKFTGEGNKQLNLTSEHIKAIFEQYPIMRIVYDEVVPKRIKDDREFWSRFFQSQLYSTLRGLKVDRRTEARDAIMDQYLEHPELTGARPTPTELHIPKFIDLEGNEENHSQRKGNRPDAENRQSSLEKGPIIRRLNAISEKLMAAVKPSDVDASAPVGVDESEYEQLRLRDLAARDEQQRIALNIRDQSHLFSDNRGTTEDAEVARIRGLNPSKAIQKVTHRLDDAYSKPGNAPVVDIEDDEDEYMDEDELRQLQADSGSSLANKHIFELIKAHRDQSTEAASLSNNPKTYGGLSEQVYERLILTHATTLEFLRQFWSAFLSGDPSRAAEIASLSESLNRALDRINAIAADAQADREEKIKSYEGQAAQIFKQTGKRRKVDHAAVGGGENVVRHLLGPCVKSLKIAVDKYRITYEEQMRELQSQQVGE
ncbi:RNA polymerase II transcription factor B subunit 1 [Exophiala xenobiotica]|uniref:RNA polymerase II transcription factor B subunit 1 n=1 Tax=Lithohypha guttulata TaxID=1690604 RepID=A0ABR0K5M6_9EURO|nr:RNA polymerase II transcription factor B subunit 1 [Lithohypha guttulata]KAK5324309.1 RNA polymerase II transcription factor B subunit 1 [Exophiala xenobiotica]